MGKGAGRLRCSPPFKDIFGLLLSSLCFWWVCGYLRRLDLFRSVTSAWLEVEDKLLVGSNMTFRRPLVFSPSDHFDSQSISLFLKIGSGPDVRVPDPRPSRGSDSASTPAPACGGGSAEAPAEARKTRASHPTPSPADHPPEGGGGGWGARSWDWLRALGWELRGVAGGRAVLRGLWAWGKPRQGRAEPHAPAASLPVPSFPTQSGEGGCGEETGRGGGGKHPRVLFPVEFFCPFVYPAAQKREVMPITLVVSDLLLCILYVIILK